MQSKSARPGHPPTWRVTLLRPSSYPPSKHTQKCVHFATREASRIPFGTLSGRIFVLDLLAWKFPRAAYGSVPCRIASTSWLFTLPGVCCARRGTPCNRHQGPEQLPILVGGDGLLRGRFTTRQQRNQWMGAGFGWLSQTLDPPPLPPPTHKQGLCSVLSGPYA